MPEKTHVTAPQAQHQPMELSWENVSEPGAYVDVGTGELYRIPQEALLQGARP